MIRWVIFPLMLVGLPISGILLAGYPVEQYLEFPPRSRYVVHAGHSWPYFVAFLFLILAFVVPVLKRCLYPFAAGINPSRHPVAGFPWWGWVGLTLGGIFWTLAWSRWDWFARWQTHTFTPLWLCYILVINALCFRFNGRCMLVHRTGYFLTLFPISALFWWFFEYLNRFVQNWYYIGVQFPPWQYFLLATLSFSTVLPAVLATRDWLLGTTWIKTAFSSWVSIRVTRSAPYAAAGLFFSGFGLVMIGVWPNYLFPLLWVSPLVIILSIQTLINKRHIFSDLQGGDWRCIVSAALAAVVCGFFWEMWNFWSLAKWEYRVPFVHRFPVFEMPVLGYAGYLPFGLECAVIGDMVGRLMKSRPRRPAPPSVD